MIHCSVYIVCCVILNSVFAVQIITPCILIHIYNYTHMHIDVNIQAGLKMHKLWRLITVTISFLQYIYVS